MRNLRNSLIWAMIAIMGWIAPVSAAAVIQSPVNTRIKDVA